MVATKDPVGSQPATSATRWPPDCVKRLTFPSAPIGTVTNVDTVAPTPSTFRFEALETAWREATFADDREHVVTFIEEDSERFNLAYVDANEALRSRSHWRLTVDEADDLDLLRRLYAATDGELFDLDSAGVLAAVEADAESLALATRHS